MPLVSIIIVNWNAKKYIKDCIDSLLLQTFTDYEIVLVDNVSSDGSVDFVKTSYPQVKIIQNKENLGFAEGNNIGIKNSTGNFIALFNPDAVADKDWLQILVNVIKDKPKIAGITGKMYYLGDKYGKDAVFCTWSKVDPLSANPTNFHDDEPVSLVDYLTGAAMIVRRDVLDKIGLLDKDYFLYFEETDLCARMIRAGYDLMYVPTAVVWHAVSPLSSSDKKIYFMERSRIRFALKNFDSTHIIPFVLIFLGETAFVVLRDIKQRNFLRTKTRFRAIWWNMVNLGSTMHSRKDHMGLVGPTKLSYNKNLPLRSVKTA